MVSMMIEFTSNNHQIERICFNSFIITRQNDDGGREIISMVPFDMTLGLLSICTAQSLGLMNLKSYYNCKYCSDFNNSYKKPFSKKQNIMLKDLLISSWLYCFKCTLVLMCA